MNPKLLPYLNFNGQSFEAMKFYQSVLGGQLNMQTFAEAGMPVSDEIKDQIVHAHLENDWMTIMASDGGEHHQVTMGNSVNLSINGSDEELLTKIFNGLAEGGTIDMALEKQFWGDTYGQLTDKFGIHWMVNISSSSKTENNQN